MQGYQYERPSAAANPAMALWDPVLSQISSGRSLATFPTAHLQPDSARLSRWRNTFNQDHPVLSNRGPHITGVSPSIVLGNPKSAHAEERQVVGERRVLGQPHEL